MSRPSNGDRVLFGYTREDVLETVGMLGLDVVVPGQGEKGSGAVGSGRAVSREFSDRRYSGKSENETCLQWQLMTHEITGTPSRGVQQPRRLSKVRAWMSTLDGSGAGPSNRWPSVSSHSRSRARCRAGGRCWMTLAP